MLFQIKLYPLQSKLAKIKFMLLCKPARRAGIVFEQTVPKITIRSLELNRDGSYLAQSRHTSIEAVYDRYKGFLNDKSTHSFVGLFQHKRICLIDISDATVSEPGKHIRLRPHDCCMQLSINALSHSAADIIEDVLNAFLCYFFSFPCAGFLYATPGIHDYKECRILEGGGFIFQENIILSSKAASLYLLTRTNFCLKYKIRRG
jgi:hypothetical protein